MLIILLSYLSDIRVNKFCSFGTKQTRVPLYMTASSSLSKLVGKPEFKVNPNEGLEVELSGSGANGSSPTTLSPSMLILDRRCEKARDTPYEIAITIQVEGYEPIEFTLTKMCGEFFYLKIGRIGKRMLHEDGLHLVCFLAYIFIIISTLSCCGGFIYRTRFEHQLSEGGGQGGYTRAEDLNGSFANQASLERQPVAAQGTQRPSERKYGSI